MFRNLFVNRLPELSFLEKRWSEDKAQLVVIVGRRRVGKTELIRRFIASKPGVYFLADASPLDKQLQRFSAMVEHATHQTLPRTATSWADVLCALANEEKRILAIDEFGYMVERDQTILSEFQRAWDEKIQESRLFIIICGSSVSLMENEVLGVKSPLYGRRTGYWRLDPLGFSEIRHFFPRYTIDDLARTYMSVGGIPAYLSKFDADIDFWANMEAKLLNRGDFLYDEPEFLLRTELREPYSYFGIVEAAAKGKVKLNDISTHAKIEVRSLPKYIQVLQRLAVLEKVTPVGERKMKTHRYAYRVKDHFLAFWFRYVYPHKDLLELGNTEQVMQNIRRDFDSYAGPRFEDIALQTILASDPGLVVNEHGKWWSGQTEIDLVFLEKKNGKYTKGSFFEVKWSSLTNKHASRYLTELEDKVKNFPFRLKEKKLGLFARQVENTKQLRREGYLIFELQNTQ